MTPKKNEDEFLQLTATIQRLLGIQCGSYKVDYIKRRIASRMNAMRIPSYAEYQAYLLAHREERDLLKNALTINVTKFLRDPEVFEIIRKDILPSIYRQKKRFRIWSAGCSSGEEAYTLAILLSEMKVLNKDLDPVIYATDIDEGVLKKAKDGIYEKSALENLSEYQVRRHFIQLPDGKYEVKPHLRELVRFSWHDLMKGVPVSRYIDMISCRNVTIYFTEKQKDDLVRMFHEGLSPGGFYVMGMSEYLGKEVDSLFTPYKPLQKIFTRVP